MKVLTSLKNAVLAALSVLQQSSLPQQLQIDDFSVDIEKECGRLAEFNVQDDGEDTSRPSKRPRISISEPALDNTGMEAKLFLTLHRALGLREAPDLGDFSQIAQMKMSVLYLPKDLSVLTAAVNNFYNYLKMITFEPSR